MKSKASAKAEAPESQEAEPLEEFEGDIPRAVTFSTGVTRSRKETGRPPAREKAGSAARPRDPKPAATGVGRYLEVLGLGPNATFDAINTAYYTCIKRFPENPTEEDETRLQDVKRAYDILKRNYQPKEVRTFSLSVSMTFGRWALVPLLLALIGGLVAFNWKNLRLRMVHYDTGTVVALKGKSEPYGTIVGYQAVHRFPAGNPSSAYELKLEGRDTTVWVSERLIVNGMQPLKGR